MKSLILAAFVLLASLSLRATEFKTEQCTMTKGQKYFFYLKPESGEQGAFSLVRDEIPPVVVGGCKNVGGQYLAVAMGLTYPSLSSESSDMTVTGGWNTELCRIQTDGLPFEYRKEKSPTFKSEFELFKSCLVMEITGLNQFPLQIKENQESCKVKRTGQNRYQLDGEMCFVRIHPEMNAALSMVIRPECTNGEYFRKGFKFTDLEVGLRAYVVEKEDLGKIDNSIGTAGARFSFLPSSKFAPMNGEDVKGQPQFPNKVQMDIQMGNIKWQNAGKAGTYDRSVIDTFALVNNISKNAEMGARLLESFHPENFQWPLSAQAELYEIVGDKKEPIDAWNAGNEVDPFVKPQWQGLFFLGRHAIEGYAPKEGSRYEYTLRFSNPYDDFSNFVNNLNAFSIDMTGMQGMPGRDGIRPLNMIPESKRFFQLPALPGLAGNSLFYDLERIKMMLRALFTVMNFPPYYEKICGPKDCVLSQDQGVVAEIGMRFTYKKSGLENLEYFRKSKIMESYVKPVKEMAHITCQ